MLGGTPFLLRILKFSDCIRCIRKAASNTIAQHSFIFNGSKFYQKIVRLYTAIKGTTHAL